MAQGFQVRKKLENGQILEREYELVGNELVMLANRSRRAPVGTGESPISIVEAFEREMQPTIPILETVTFDSFSGSYLPSIARPLKSFDSTLHNPVDQNEIAKSYRREHNTIADDIERCFDVASPSSSNFEVFGTQFEKIIYFSCVGVESLFNKILADNQLNTYNAGTNTFVKLKPFLRIDEHRLKLVHYPWFPVFQPFDGWEASRPSASLAWFDAYNSLKHDKRNNQHKATMRNALNAAAAYYALTYAVFGGQMFTGYLSEQFFFHFEGKPNWAIDEIYFPPDEGAAWTPRNINI